MSIDRLEQARQKRGQLLALFDTLPEITLWGVVGANGPSGARTPPETHWSMHLNLIAWRIPGNAVSRVKISVTKGLADGELQALQAAIKPESVIAFRAKLCESSPFGDTRAQLLGLLDPPADTELELALSQFRAPVEVTDPVVGKLLLNKSVDWFEGKISWLGKQIDIAVSSDDNGSPADSLQTARALIGEMQRWATKVNDYAVSELLDLKNDTWLEDGESPISREEFVARMELTSITTYPEGEFEFWHDDGDLFWGHSIQVSGSLSEGLTSADIPG